MRTLRISQRKGENMKRAIATVAVALGFTYAVASCIPRDVHPERTPSPTTCNLGSGQCPMQSGRQDAPKPMA